METTLNALLTLTFFAPMAVLVVMNLLTHRTTGPSVPAPRRLATMLPMPPAKGAPVANEQRYLEAA